MERVCSELWVSFSHIHARVKRAHKQVEVNTPTLLVIISNLSFQLACFSLYLCVCFRDQEFKHVCKGHFEVANDTDACSYR